MNEHVRSGTPLGTMSGWPCDGSRPGVPVRGAGYVRTTPVPPPWLLASKCACALSAETQCLAAALDLAEQGSGPGPEANKTVAVHLPLPGASALGALTRHLTQDWKRNA